MKIGIQTWGSNGDIRPFIALAGGLSAAGHDVTLAYTSETNLGFENMAKELNFKLIKAFSRELDFSPDIIAKIAKKSVPTQIKMIMDELFAPFAEEMFEAANELVDNNDVVIWHFLVHQICALADAKNVSHISVALNHGGIPSKHMSPIGVPNSGSLINPLWWNLFDFAVKRIFSPHFNPFRKKLSLPPIKSFKKGVMDSDLLNLVAVSRLLCDRPVDWSDNHQVCGFFNIPEAAQVWEMPAELKAFIAKEPPVFMTFGSLMPPDAKMEAETIGILAKAVKLVNCRAIIQYNYQDDLSLLPEDPNIYYLSRAPHGQIFPQCSMVVHHGGAGTTQSSTMAGCPSIIVAHVTDQVLWGEELYKRGLSPKFLTRKRLSASKLARAIQTVQQTPSMKEKAQEMGKKMQSENGVDRAVELIESTLKISRK